MIMERKWIITIAVASVLLVGVVVAIAVFLSSRDAPSGDPTPGPSATIQPGNSDVTPVDPVGNAAGDFDPLEVPAGVVSGIGAEIPEDQLTQPGAELRPGDVVVVNLFQSEAHANPYSLVVVDEFSSPLEGAERTKALTDAGFPDDGERVVQRVALRTRQIAGSGDMAEWNLIRSIVPVNERLEAMTVVDTADGCSPSSAPLAGNDASTNNTVQVCIYAFGTINTPGSPISAIQITTRLGGKTVKLFIQSDKNADEGLVDSHDHGPEDHWWKIDPETGLPVVDPDTGEIVPADDDDHDH